MSSAIVYNRRAVGVILPSNHKIRKERVAGLRSKAMGSVPLSRFQRKFPALRTFRGAFVKNFGDGVLGETPMADS